MGLHESLDGRPGRGAVVVPRIVVNAKLYPEATRPAGLTAWAREWDLLAAAQGQIALVPPMVHVGLLGSVTRRFLEVVAPHVDALGPGPGTGYVSAESVRAAGARGVLLNHAEHKLAPEVLATTVKAARQAGLWVLACADNLSETRRIAGLGVDALALEVPELIGGDISITTADPQIVERAVTAAHEIAPGLPVLCGAGVKNGEDVRRARELGAHGVLVASGIVKAKNPTAALRDLLAGLA